MITHFFHKCSSYSSGAENIERVDETAVQDDAPKTSLGFKDIKQSLKRLPISILGFLKNVTFMLLIMHGVCAYLVISGLATFLPKYFESQFGLSSSDSAFMVGKSFGNVRMKYDVLHLDSNRHFCVEQKK